MSIASLITANKTASNLLTTEEAAEYLGVAQNSLAVWRTTHRYPIPYVKVGRLVKYRLNDLNTFIESRTISPEL